ncbi:AzlC family ABC transporter permease [Pseudaestuariivita rosea]|uniref:AzlC family ABC transporter permease n=1 Tax=Pseudaestuariivita rosea TaxID=2763263 RepID=UPI001ABA35B2|nr:AzlC family ABC transporter permease [Pseudaestuariivita rosea]
MVTSTTKSIFFKGVLDGLPFLLVVGPFGLLFGVIATEAGLNVAETMGFSVLVIAGASQFTAIQLMVDNAPTAIVLATALAVNLRMAMYSASITPHLGAAPLWKRALVAYFLVDQTYAVSVDKYERSDWSLPQKLAYFFGVVLPICPMWYVLTLTGAMLGEAIPDAWALDFAVPITFLALVAPALRTLPHVAAAVTSIVLALALAGLPYNVGLIIAAIVAMMVGAQAEVMMRPRK